MKRREFVKTSAIAMGAASMGIFGQKSEAREEIRYVSDLEILQILMSDGRPDTYEWDFNTAEGITIMGKYESLYRTIAGIAYDFKKGCGQYPSFLAASPEICSIFETAYMFQPFNFLTGHTKIKEAPKFYKNDESTLGATFQKHYYSPPLPDILCIGEVRFGATDVLHRNPVTLAELDQFRFSEKDFVHRGKLLLHKASEATQGVILMGYAPNGSKDSSFYGDKILSPKHYARLKIKNFII